jgi:hypothetical protein
VDTKIVTLFHDTSAPDALDAHFIAERQGRLAMARAAARGEFIHKAGIAALLTGAGVGLACWGASFLVAPKVVTVTNEKLVTLPGKETVRETVREVPGPERTVYVTPAEKAFTDSPGFTHAEIRGRIIQSVDGTALSFDTGKNWWPTDDGKAADSGPFVGDLGYCEPTANKEIFHCFALHNGAVVGVPQKAAGRPT